MIKYKHINSPIEYKEEVNLESYTDYPQAATENAKIALRWVDENGWGSCATQVGKVRAHQLANREPLSRETIGRMAAFERHRQNSNKELGDGCGRLAWLIWGGDEGIAWAQRKIKEIDSQTLQLKEWKSRPTSSNVDRISYQDETKELVVKFNDGDVYTYFDVDFAEFLDLINGQGICRTTGSNEYGSWYLGKYPSVGAALYRILVRRGKTYKKGGKI